MQECLSHQRIGMAIHVTAEVLVGLSLQRQCQISNSMQTFAIMSCIPKQLRI